MIRRFWFWTLLLPCLAGAQDDGIPVYVLQLPATVKTVLIAETDTATLHRYQFGESGLELADDQTMSVGQYGVGKQASGDRRCRDIRASPDRTTNAAPVQRFHEALWP